MSEALTNLLDLELAWKRVKADETSGRVFARRPFEIELIEVDLGGWIASLVDEIRSHRYTPSPMSLCDVPKRTGSIRPGGLLTMTDRLVYAACVGACLPHIRQALALPSESVDFAHQLSDNPNDARWLQQPFTWQDFQKNTLAMVKGGASYLLSIDIVAYYDHIDLGVLLSELKGIGAPSHAVDQLGICLMRWAQVPGRGIPQGHTSSDILGKFYLNPIDRKLRALGHSHSRCLDEFRIFCRHKVEARKASADLTRLLRERGLSLQSSKSGIYRANGLRWYLPAVIPIIWKRHERRMPRMGRIALAKLWLLMNLRLNYAKHLGGILSILQAAEDPSAIHHCRSLLRKYPDPDDTRKILKYCESMQGKTTIEPPLVAFLKSGEAILPYQRYQIIDWLCHRASIQPTDALLELIRNLVFDESQPPYLRSICREFLGEYGSASDLKQLERSYLHAADPFERSEIICCLRRLKKTRREAFLEKVERDGEWARRAVKFVRSSVLDSEPGSQA
jgi:hypothetical protein